MSQERLMKVLVSPHISEKSANIAEKNRQFVFRVIADATKPEVQSAVELMFDVKVNAVQISNVKGKAKRFGQISGRRSGWKKAYVTLAEGQDIDYLGHQ